MGSKQGPDVADHVTDVICWSSFRHHALRSCGLEFSVAESLPSGISPTIDPNVDSYLPLAQAVFARAQAESGTDFANRDLSAALFSDDILFSEAAEACEIPPDLRTRARSFLGRPLGYFIFSLIGLRRTLFTNIF